jgi:hypothetical protein
MEAIEFLDFLPHLKPINLPRWTYDELIVREEDMNAIITWTVLYTRLNTIRTTLFSIRPQTALSLSSPHFAQRPP